MASEGSPEEPKPQEPPARWKPTTLEDLLPGPDSPGLDPNPELHPLTDRPLIRNDPAEVERVAALADFIWPDREVGRRVGMFGKVGGRDKVSSFWAIDIECAILKAAIKDRAGELKTGDPWDYPHGILRNPPDWAEGRPVNTAGIRAGLLADLDQGDDGPVYFNAQDDEDDDRKCYKRENDPIYSKGVTKPEPPKVEPKKPGFKWLARIKRDRTKPPPAQSKYLTGYEDD